MTDVLRAINMSKRRGRHLVLDGVDLNVRRGEILTCMGPNGAGKSTLISILSGLSRPDTGSVHLDSEDLFKLGVRGRARLGVALQRPGFSSWMTVRETLSFFAACYRGDQSINDLISRFRLTAFQNCQSRRLSEGQNQQASVALAFLKSFDVILLDEPMAGLDPENRQVIWREIRRARERGAAVFCATHLVEEAQQHSDRILVLHAGRQKALDTPEALLEQLPAREKIEITHDQDLGSALEGLTGVADVFHHGQTATLYCRHARQVMQELLDRATFRSVACGPVSLIDVLRRFTKEKRLS